MRDQEGMMKCGNHPLDPAGKRRLDRLVRQDWTKYRESRATTTWQGEEKEEGRRKKKESERGR
jgi:hypothetical protein